MDPLAFVLALVPILWLVVVLLVFRASADAGGGDGEP